MNPILEKLIVELDKPMHGDPWYGTSVEKVFDTISYKEAFAKPFSTVHSIAEIVLHIHAWIFEVSNRLKGNEPADPPMGDWPEVQRTDEDNWNEIKANVYHEHEKLIELVKLFPFEKLEERVGRERVPALGTGFTFREMLVGLMQHNIYHLGQIALLKKLL